MSAADSTAYNTMFMDLEDLAAVRNLLRVIETRSGGSPSKFFTMCMHVQRVLTRPGQPPALSRLKRLADKVADVGGLVSLLGGLWSVETWDDVQAVLASVEHAPQLGGPMLGSPLGPMGLLDTIAPPAMVANAKRPLDTAMDTAVQSPRIASELCDTASSPQKPKRRNRQDAERLEEIIEHQNMIAALDHQLMVASVLPPAVMPFASPMCHV